MSSFSCVLLRASSNTICMCNYTTYLSNAFAPRDNLVKPVVSFLAAKKNIVLSIFYACQFFFWRDDAQTPVVQFLGSIWWILFPDSALCKQFNQTTSQCELQIKFMLSPVKIMWCQEKDSSKTEYVSLSINRSW